MSATESGAAATATLERSLTADDVVHLARVAANVHRFHTLSPFSMRPGARLQDPAGRARVAQELETTVQQLVEDVPFLSSLLDRIGEEGIADAVHGANEMARSALLRVAREGRLLDTFKERLAEVGPAFREQQARLGEYRRDPSRQLDFELPTGAAQCAAGFMWASAGVAIVTLGALTADPFLVAGGGFAIGYGLTMSAFTCGDVLG
jgi:hypothetical protein